MLGGKPCKPILNWGRLSGNLMHLVVNTKLLMRQPGLLTTPLSVSGIAVT